jgi:hypothetical protein
MKKTLLLLTSFITLEFLFSCSLVKKEQATSSIKPYSELSFPVYGNYCGPLHPPKGMNPVAIDGVDNACKNHDKCYENYGYFNKNCDLKIIENLKKTNPTKESENLARKLLIFYFQETLKYKLISRV